MGDGRQFAVGLARAAGGAVIFGLPLLMTMEMWSLGFTMDRARLLLLVLLLLPALVALSHHAGFEPTFEWREDLIDALIAYGVGFAASCAVLVLLGVLTTATAFDDALGKITVQSIPASVGAMLGRTLLGGAHADEDGARHATYGGDLFIMATGALFLSFSIAPTEEVLQLAVGLSAVRALVIMIVSLVLMHAFVYAVEFHGQVARREHASPAGEFIRLTVVGYAVALAVSAYVLWTFGRTDGLHSLVILRSTIVLGFPAAIGAAAARLIL